MCVRPVVQAVPSPGAVMSPMRPDRRRHHHRWSRGARKLYYIIYVLSLSLLLLLLLLLLSYNTRHMRGWRRRRSATDPANRSQIGLQNAVVSGGGSAVKNVPHVAAALWGLNGARNYGYCVGDRRRQQMVIHQQRNWQRYLHSVYGVHVFIIYIYIILYLYG